MNKAKESSEKITAESFENFIEDQLARRLEANRLTQGKSGDEFKEANAEAERIMNDAEEKIIQKALELLPVLGHEELIAIIGEMPFYSHHHNMSKFLQGLLGLMCEKYIQPPNEPVEDVVGETGEALAGVMEE